MKTYKTAEVAAIIGIHPNTIRLYEKLQLIPKPEPLSNGYRVFTDFHIEQCRLVRIAFFEPLLTYKKIFTEVAMDNFVDERDLKILEHDRYTFFVLRCVIGGTCKLLLTDHERLIICFTDHPFPVWIWTPDDASEAEMEKAYQIVSEQSLLNGEYRFNLKYDLAKFFIERAAVDGKKLSVCMNMLAYDCRNPVRPNKMADGSIHRCSSEDLDELVDLIDLFQKETGIDQNDRDGYRRDAEAFIRAGNTFFWKNEQGDHVASCKYAADGTMASINLVFTRPRFRRKHYAQNLVYQVTKLAMDAGYVPMLYTDADYTASNACYEKIGYVLRGKLCTIG